MFSKSISSSQNKLDKVGIVCSGMCAIHCVLTSLFALVSPFIATFFENMWIHVCVLMLLTPIATIAFYRGRKLHQKNRSIYLACIGILFLALAIVINPLFEIQVELLEGTLTTIGGIFLVSAHLFNISSLKSISLLEKV